MRSDKCSGVLLKLKYMVNIDQLLTMKAIAICFKPYLKPEEAIIYCNLGRTQLASRCAESGVFKTGCRILQKGRLRCYDGGTAFKAD